MDDTYLNVKTESKSSINTPNREKLSSSSSEPRKNS